MKDNNFHTFNSLLQKFDPISLTAMDCVKLMDRTDVKFVFSFNKLEPVLKALLNHYYILTINGVKVFSYRTEYFDTPAMNMFTDHHNGKLNRFKIRQREYIDSDLRFLEVKFKSNTGRVIKDRIEKTYADKTAFTGFVKKYTPYSPKNLNLTLINLFNRFTLVDKSMRERVTVDMNVSFTDNVHGLLLNGLVILEVKQNCADKKSHIFHVLKSNTIRPASISKYCMGISMLNKHVKFNNFKKTLLMINKMSNVELSA
jgi:hypothetical protein